MTRRRLLAGLAALPASWLVAALSPPAEAHRARVTLTKVSRNAQTGRWEFVHSFHQHDAALAITALTGDAEGRIASPAGQARLALEIERTMRWTAPSGRSLGPVTEGAELVGTDLAVYQTLPDPGETGEYLLECRLLQGILPEVSNTVQFAVVDPPQVERFSTGRTTARFRLSPP